ncbi:MAG: ABC-type nitrate/sulfonate/bicarbonate transport system periplasmic component-like protein [Microbacteriaceae bacterium]|jgi:NitT/TauT family transport system substrate-binding protein|nr:ABC-type nitrate/sulfonate/bicarbonate transport system periplasmic component-like protein [Microbacteriaceae bacterium]HEV7956471.1 ABC transporter substrate-binding protein [Marisediminicola sp.]
MARGSRTAATIGAALATVFTLSACSGGAGAPTEASDAAPALTVAFASDLDPNDIAEYRAIVDSGAEIEKLTDNDAAVAGIVNGNFDIANIDATSAVNAGQAGVPITVIYPSQLLPEFVFVAQSDIASVADLEGRSVAYHGAGSLTEVLPKEWVNQESPEIFDTIDWSALPESPNRAAAMVAGRIDATALEYGDVLTLQEEGDFNVLANWSDLEGESGAVINTVWVVNSEFLEQNRDAVADFLREVQASYDDFYNDKDAWIAEAEKQLPDVNPDFLPEIYDYYVGVGMYARSGETPLTEERWNAMDAMYISLGEYTDASPASLVDYDLIAEVNKS